MPNPRGINQYTKGSGGGKTPSAPKKSTSGRVGRSALGSRSAAKNKAFNTLRKKGTSSASTNPAAHKQKMKANPGRVAAFRKLFGRNPHPGERF